MTKRPCSRIFSFAKRLLAVLFLTVLFYSFSEKILPSLKTFFKPPFTQTLLHPHPEIRLYSNFISPEEADHLIRLAKDKLQPSLVLAQGTHKHDTQWRTSSSAYLAKSQDAVVQKIEHTVSQLLGCPLENIEPLQIVHYAKGEYFLPHHDYFSEEELTHQGSQRAFTVLIYLNTLAENEGGSTSFPLLNIHIRPQKGNALYFQQLDEQGKGHPLTLHSGDPIQVPGVEKWACNVWIREKYYGRLPLK